jgi:hypothetical protein
LLITKKIELKIFLDFAPLEVLQSNTNDGSTKKILMADTNWVVVSFKLDPELYKKLCRRLSGWGERSLFFRTVTEKFLTDELVVETDARQL